jgi:YHS domain-containing protein/thioredoxin-related protein
MFCITGLNRKTMSTPLLNCRPCLFAALTVVISVCVLTVSALAQGNAFPPPPIRWETDVNAAMARAEREQRLLFFHFANDSPSAQQMEREVFVQPHIASRLNATFVMVKINATENAALAQRHAVESVPTDLIMKPNGQTIHRRNGVIPAERFVGYLDFLQTTIQSSAPPATNPLPVGNSAGMPHPQPHPQPTPPPSQLGTGMMPLQQMAVIPNTARDPFMQQPPVIQHPPVMQQPPVTQHPPVMQHPPATMAGTMLPPHSNNPLRIGDTAARPHVNNTVLPPPQGPINVIAPPVVAAMPSISAIMAEEPASDKMTVEVPLALEGFCPVTLCAEEKWVSGNPAYCTMYQGHIFRFATAEALVTFARNPLTYLPVAMGEDIVLMVDRNRRVNGNRKFGAWFQGRIFLFSSQETLNAFAKQPDYYMEIAVKYETARREQPLPLVY